MTILSDPRGTMPMRSGIGEPDFGTPKSESDVMVSVTIDGETHTVPEGTSVMRAAGDAGCGGSASRWRQQRRWGLQRGAVAAARSQRIVLRAERGRWGKLVKDIGLQPE